MFVIKRHSYNYQGLSECKMWSVQCSALPKKPLDIHMHVMYFQIVFPILSIQLLVLAAFELSVLTLLNSSDIAHK